MQLAQTLYSLLRSAAAVLDDFVQTNLQAGEHLRVFPGEVCRLALVCRKIKQLILRSRFAPVTGGLLGRLADQLPSALAESKVAAAVVLLDQMVASFGLRFSQQCPQDIEAVDAGIIRQRLSGQSRQTCGQVDRADDLTGNAGSDPALPAGDERSPRAAFEDAVLPAAIRPSGEMGTELFNCVVLVPSSRTGPLSEQTTISVFSARLSRSSVFISSPTHQSNSSMQSPRRSQSALP